MIFLVQAIKKLFVTCQAAYDVRGLGTGPQSYSTYTHCAHTHTHPKWVAAEQAEMGHEKQVTEGKSR